MPARGRRMTDDEVQSVMEELATAAHPLAAHAFQLAGIDTQSTAPMDETKFRMAVMSLAMATATLITYDLQMPPENGWHVFKVGMDAMHAEAVRLKAELN